MEQMRIKGMVCRRCISTVKDIFLKEGFLVSRVDLGEVVYRPGGTQGSIERVKYALFEAGFQPLDDKQSRIIAQVKELVEESVSGGQHPWPTFSAVVARSLGMDYGTVSALFSQTVGVSLEQYLIARRVEKAKDLILRTGLSLTDISFQLGYSSVHHLSNQFKKITGLTPTAFRTRELEKVPGSDLPSE